MALNRLYSSTHEYDTQHTVLSLSRPSFLVMHVQGALPHSSFWAHSYETLTGPSLSSRFTNSSPAFSVKCPAKTKAVQQRTKQSGISVLRLSAQAHPYCVTLNIIKHSPGVTHNTTKHSSGAVLLKQTLRWNPWGWGEWRRSWGGGCEGGQELMVFMLNSQRVGNAWNTIPMFSLPQLIRQNDRGSRFPYRESCHLDIYPHQGKHLAPAGSFHRAMWVGVILSYIYLGVKF